MFRQDSDTLTWFFKTGLRKAEGTPIDVLMQGEWRFWRETGELWQVGHFRDGVKHGEWLRFARDGPQEKRERFENGKAMKARRPT